MAAVLCIAIGDLWTSSCNAIGKVICLPCKALNLGCEKLGDFLCTPMVPFVVFTFGLMTPALVYGVRSLDNYDCPDLFRWMIVNAVFAIFHMVGCIYIVQRLQDPGPQAHLTASMATATSSKVNPTASAKVEEGYFVRLSENFSTPRDHQRGGPNSVSRVKHLFCYDMGMAVYILLVLFWVTWICVGIKRRFRADDGNEACQELYGYMNIAITCAYIWMTMVGLAFCCSFLCLH